MIKTVTLLTAGSLTLALLLVACSSESNKKGPPSPGYSQTMSESRENKVFEFELIRYKSNSILDNELSLDIEDAWVENRWTYQNQLIGQSPIKKSDMHQLIINLNVKPVKDKPRTCFYFLGDVLLEGRVYYHHGLKDLDTIRAPLYRETSSIPKAKKDRTILDYITFVRH